MEEKKKLYNGKYEKIKRIGGGSFGNVFLVKEGDKLFAMKKFFLDNIDQGGAKRQFELLNGFKHENVHEVIEMFVKEKTKNEYLITKYYKNNLYDFVTKNLPEKIIKGIVYQIIKGIAYLHSLNYVHRDIKPDNILISPEGIIKLTDFDLCRLISKGVEDRMSRTAVTLYYRAPEIFYGDYYYGQPIDIWSIGCVFCELVLGFPVFKGYMEIGTIGKIVSIIGCPDEDNWPGVSKLPNYLPFNNGAFTLDKILAEKNLSQEGINFATKLLTLDPSKRPKSKDLLEDEYFKRDTATPEELKEFMELK